MMELIDDIAHNVYESIKITRDFCAYNEYFAQESLLTETLELQESLLEKLFEIY